MEWSYNCVRHAISEELSIYIFRLHHTKIKNKNKNDVGSGKGGGRGGRAVSRVPPETPVVLSLPGHMYSADEAPQLESTPDLASV
jgi:hypothetical protein